MTANFCKCPAIRSLVQFLKSEEVKFYLKYDNKEPECKEEIFWTLVIQGWSVNLSLGAVQDKNGINNGLGKLNPK